ncbi:MAG TPA: UDP-4-amino-4,6-dideoxy-N-acetyl-beta-L-altrosamine transaminase [Vicinamibacterales bacterium]|nr:UDP-4-amino-4,6-dideoxy-N-acetyl-beta-L-altrosamine transaminase [Vicinamibacterales bacterium]
MSAESRTLAPRTLPYGRQCLDAEDRQAVLDVLSGDWLTQGPMVERFEGALSEALGSTHAVACSNGTAALHLAALALGWTPGDVVLVPAITFLASANCCAYVGAEPYFVDVDDRTITIDPNDTEARIKQLRAAGRRVRGVVAVDMGGHPADWVALRELADRYDLHLVDDACHALGATYAGGDRIGSGKHADVTLLSFHPVKHITTGEGGAVLANDGRVAERARLLRSHGMVRGPEDVPNWEGPWHSDMVELGFNYRLTDMQCALGLSQLRKLPAFVERRRSIAARYTQKFAGTAVRTPEEQDGARHAYHLYLARTSFDRVSRREFFERCRDRGILLQVHYRPVPLNSFYRKAAWNADIDRRIPVSLRYYDETFSLPMFPSLEDAEVDRVVETVLECLA